MQTTDYLCPVLTKTGMCLRILVKLLIMAFYESSSAVVEFLFAYRQNDRQTDGAILIGTSQ
jgi:hypothetical protein